MRDGFRQNKGSRTPEEGVWVDQRVQIPSTKLLARMQRVYGEATATPSLGTEPIEPRSSLRIAKRRKENEPSAQVQLRHLLAVTLGKLLPSLYLFLFV